MPPGFVGKAVLAQIVRELPETTVTVLLRGNDPRQRLENEVLTSAPFEGLDGSAVEAISGDLGGDGLTGARGIDVVIHCAASALLRAVPRRGARAQRQGPDPACSTP